jgi:hypothetical protein
MQFMKRGVLEEEASSRRGTPDNEDGDDIG